MPASVIRLGTASDCKATIPSLSEKMGGPKDEFEKAKTLFQYSSPFNLAAMQIPLA